MERIKVLLVDDHPFFREGLRQVFEKEPDLEVVAEEADGRAAIQRAQELHPDVVILDINLPSMNGLQVTRELKNTLPNTAVVLLTAYHDEEQLIHSMRAGASAYFAKDVTPARLVEGLHHVHQRRWVIGEKVLDQEQMAAWLIEQLEEIATPGLGEGEPFSPLSRREMEILQHTARGQSNKEIARALGISQQTVKNHISSILRKLPVRDRTEAAVYALRHGWIRLEDTRRDQAPPS
ncbi:MAG: response regulator transcription factor [Chloroflexi bacterium]|nr:response regulator transcription factor [Chloroflexota bacterium]